MRARLNQRIDRLFQDPFSRSSASNDSVISDEILIHRRFRCFCLIESLRLFLSFDLFFCLSVRIYGLCAAALG